MQSARATEDGLNGAHPGCGEADDEHRQMTRRTAAQLAAQSEATNNESAETQAEANDLGEQGNTAETGK